MQYKLPTESQNNSGCGTAVLAEMAKSATVRTADEIEALETKMKNFNEGSYERALILKESATGGFTFLVNLSLLHHFFNLDILYPQKRLVSIELKLNDPSKTLIKAASDTEKYRLSVVEAHLDLSYVTLEAAIRSRYYELISQENLMRTYPLTRETHFSLKSGMKIYYLPQCTAYGQSANFLTILLTEEESHIGNYSNRYVYKPHDLKTLNLFRNGGPHWLNAHMSGMDLSRKTSKHVYHLYKEFLSMYPKTAESVSLSKFFSDFFIFCVDLTAVPPEMRKQDDGKQNLSLITSTSLDLSLEFNKATTKNLIVHVISNHYSVASFGPTGEIIVNE